MVGVVKGYASGRNVKNCPMCGNTELDYKKDGSITCNSCQESFSVIEKEHILLQKYIGNAFPCPFDDEESQKWVIAHRQNIEEAFQLEIADVNLHLFFAYNTLVDMEKEFSDLADLKKDYVQQVLDKFVIRIG